MKNLWVVRSRRKLFTGLAFALGGFLLFYTLLTLLVLEPDVPWKTWFGPSSPATASKFRLLLLPLLSLAVSTLLHLGARRDRLPFRKKAMPEAQRGLYASLVAGGNFLAALLLFFWQLDRLNFAKGIPGFSSLVPLAILIVIPIYTGYAIRKISLAGKGERT